VILPVAEPYDWPRVLDWLGTRAIPGLEEVGGGAYRRGDVTVTYRGDGELQVEGEADPAVVARVFDAAHDPAALPGDPVFAGARGIRVPGAWSGWELAVRAVLGQQVSVAGARRTAEKLVAGRGRFPVPAEVAGEELPGMPSARHRALRALARAVLKGLDLDPPLDLAATRAALLDLPGFGPWTVEYIAMRALRDSDAWPASDLWLRRATDAGADPERWRPHPANAAKAIWQPPA
jgi:3-methyladenine DNA glycosylase/8-oxoguanine DNA glycosylase